MLTQSSGMDWLAALSPKLSPPVVIYSLSCKDSTKTMIQVSFFPVFLEQLRMQNWNIRYNKNGPKAKNEYKDFSGTWHCTTYTENFFTTECVTAEQLTLACFCTKKASFASFLLHWKLPLCSSTGPDLSSLPSSSSSFFPDNGCLGAQREVGEKVSAFPDDNCSYVYNELCILWLSISQHMLDNIERFPHLSVSL